MAAWRKPSAQRTLRTPAPGLPPPRQLYDTGFDDDGEKYGGRRLEKVLDEMRVEGAVVVARWYGGVMLGPVRFAHIEQVARQAIRRAAEGRGGGAGGLGGPAPVVTAAAAVASQPNSEAEERRLRRVLEERDRSIRVLRSLLGEKLKQTDAPAASSSQDVYKAPEYGALTLPVLKRLEKARDNTIAWVLKEIDRVEAEGKKANGGVAVGEALDDGDDASPAEPAGSVDDAVRSTGNVHAAGDANTTDRIHDGDHEDAAIEAAPADGDSATSRGIDTTVGKRIAGQAPSSTLETDLAEHKGDDLIG